MKLIDKAAVVAEIKRQLAFYLKEIEDNKKDPWSMDIAKRDILQEILSFLDTLEVKEVDLEREIDLWVKNLHSVPNFEELNKFARHFFELGLKLRKD